MESIRAFIAIELPDEVKSVLSQLENDLKRSTQAPVKWVAPASMHLTLKFLGNVAGDKVPEISQAIQETTRKTAPFSLELAQPGAFPNLHSPRVLWVGIQGDTGDLSNLQKSIENALTPLGFPPEGKTFSPHLTLGRVREKLSPEDRRHLGELVSSRQVTPEAPFRVDALNLMRSTLMPSGAVYECLYSSALSGR